VIRAEERIRFGIEFTAIHRRLRDVAARLDPKERFELSRAQERQTIQSSSVMNAILERSLHASACPRIDGTDKARTLRRRAEGSMYGLKHPWRAVWLTRLRVAERGIVALESPSCRSVGTKLETSTKHGDDTELCAKIKSHDTTESVSAMLNSLVRVKIEGIRIKIVPSSGQAVGSCRNWCPKFAARFSLNRFERSAIVPILCLNPIADFDADLSHVDFDKRARCSART